MTTARDLDVAIIGAGAAGLATAIFARRARPDLRIALIDGARRPGAKILVSGGSRCNVTNAVVTDADFHGGRRPIIRRVLQRLPVDDTVAFFRDLGVPLHEEAHGKLFPDANTSRAVLDALLAEAARLGVELRAGTRVQQLMHDGHAWVVAGADHRVRADAVVLATGGLSLPKTGSDGWGLRAAAALGHTIVPTTPALVPLLLGHGTSTSWRAAQGIAHEARLDLLVDGRVATRTRGSLLWTHFGISGPAALDFSRHWLRAELDGQQPRATMSLLPDATFDDVEQHWLSLARDRPRSAARNVLAQDMPAGLATMLLEDAHLPDDLRLASLSREARRSLVHAMVQRPLDITGSRGYSYAEVTAGGVSLAEVDPSTLESRIRPGLHFVGEVLDVDGRLGGFNFQWAWASARVVGEALRLRPDFEDARRNLARTGRS